MDRIAGLAFKLTRYLTETNTAHNAFITRAKTKSDSSYDAVRVFVFAREPVVGRKDPAVNSMAACELAGHILCYQEEAFHTLTEDKLIDDQVNATKRVFDLVRPDVVKLFRRE